MFNRLTSTFFPVMVVLSSIGLMVGGVGVVAIMVIFVSERTCEIGACQGAARATPSRSLRSPTRFL